MENSTQNKGANMESARIDVDRKTVSHFEKKGMGHLVKFLKEEGVEAVLGIYSKKAAAMVYDCGTHKIFVHGSRALFDRYIIEGNY